MPRDESASPQRGARRVAGFSIQFDDAARQKIQHFIKQIRDVVQKLEIDENKRDALTKKIRALESEVDRKRTHLQAFGDLVIEAAGDISEAAELLAPVRKLLDSIAKVIHGARAEEEQMKLPAPADQKRIEHKKVEPSQPSPPKELDDEIPF